MVVAHIVSGQSGKGDCMNNPECECLADKGPIPRGDYSLSSREISNPGHLWDILRNTRADWGDWRVPLYAAPDTNTFGRSGFKIHGGNIDGSAGCIDVGGGVFGDDTTTRLLNDIINDFDGIVHIKVR